MITIWALVRWIHLMSAIAWIGGMLFIVMVMLPVLRKQLAPDERTVLIGKVARRYGTVSWVALALLVVTGVLNTERRGVDWSHLLAGRYGQILAIKLGFVAVVIVITLVHALYFGNRLARIAEEARAGGATDAVAVAKRQRLQRWSIVLSSLNLLLNLLIVFLAAALVA